MDTAQRTGVYDISVEHGSLQRVQADLGGARYCLHLNGAIDENWAAAYQLERRESRTSSRFELDPVAKAVWFAGVPGGDSTDIIDALDILDALVDRVNQRASRTGH